MAFSDLDNKITLSGAYGLCGSNITVQANNGWSSSCGTINLLNPGVVPTMHKTEYAVIQDGGSGICRSFPTLAEAKAHAKLLAGQQKATFLVVKAVYSVSPKFDVDEEDL